MLKTSLGLKHIENNEDLRAELNLVTKTGFDTVDLDLSMDGQLEMLHSPDMPRLAKEARGILDEYGMKVYQGHAPFGIHQMNDPEFDKMRLKEVADSLEAAAILGIEYMIIHPFFAFDLVDPYFLQWDEILEKNIEIFSRYVAQGKELGVKICTENMFAMNANRTESYRSLFSSPENLNALMDAVPGLTCCLDTGHALVGGYDIAELVRKLGQRLTTLHLHNNNRKFDLHLPPFQHFATDWYSFCKALKEVHYQGSMNLEVAGFVSVCPEEMLLPSYQYLYATSHTLAQMVENA